MTQICADRLFAIVESTSNTHCDTTWEQLEDDSARRQSRKFKVTVVAAHQALAEASPELAERFAPLAEAMQQELAKETWPDQT